MSALEVVASSWPIAVMFLGLCVAGVTLYITRSLRKSAEDQRVFSASNARDVTRHRQEQ